jgi:hypothetical protein
LALTQNINPPNNLYFYFSQDLTKNYESFSENKESKIISDKFIKLKKVLVDRLDPGIGFIKSVVLKNKDSQINSNYWGFNGTVDITFDQDNSFLWHLKQRATATKTGVIDQHKF